MISSDWFSRTRKKLEDRFDLVLIDAPPIHHYPETVLLASQGMGVLLVICAESTKREVALGALKKVEAARGRILGVVLNRRRHYIPRIVYKRL
jgi:Mrp family chromosome partitioning ATPase